MIGDFAFGFATGLIVLWLARPIRRAWRKTEIELGLRPPVDIRDGGPR